MQHNPGGSHVTLKNNANKRNAVYLSASGRD
nr:MAG TPA: hypothetical protein [Caudoviricetes sp.]